MRIRTFAVVTLVLLPSLATAQRRTPIGGTIGGRGPAQPAPLPTPAPELARRIAYQRSKFSFESYPLFSQTRAPELATSGARSKWSSYGSGIHAEYRSVSSLSAALDLTSTFGDPVRSQTVELGARYRPVPMVHAFRPYVDVRAAYSMASGTYGESPFDIVPAGLPQQSRYGSQSSRGLGALAGVGTEYWFAQQFAVTTGAAALRSNMEAYHSTGTTLPADGRYWMTSYRFTIGLKYNPVRSMVLH